MKAKRPATRNLHRNPSVNSNNTTASQKNNGTESRQRNRCKDRIVNSQQSNNSIPKQLSKQYNKYSSISN